MACLHHHSLSFLGHSALDAEKQFAEPGVDPHYAPSRTCRIAHLDLQLDLWPAEERFAGTARVDVEPLPSFKGDVRLDLDEVVVDGVTDEQGEALDWVHDDGELVIRDVEAPLTVVVRWHGSQPRLGLYFTGPAPWAPERQHMAWTQCQDEDGHYLLPCHDHPGVKHSWSIRLTGPEGYTLLSNGALVEQGTDDGRAYAVYEQTEPMPVYLFTAVCAKLSVTEAHWRDVPVRYLVPEGEEAHAERAMAATPEMIELFAERTGVPFPWPRYDTVVVHDFVFGGMENVACTTMTDVLLVDEKAAVEWDPDGLVAHELAHQWFGDLVTCQDWSQGWLNESWATFMEVVWWEHAKGEPESAWYRWQLAQAYFDEHDDRYRRPIVSYRFREPIDVFDRHLYQKGACVLNTLRNELGEDAFWTGVAAYLDRHAHSTVHSRHFQRALEDATGRNLDRFFREWIHGAGHPQVEVKLGKSDGLLTVAVKQTQEGDDVAEAFSFPLRLVLVPEGGEPRTIDLPVSERERAWALPLDGPLTTVRVDPGFRVLADLTLKGPRGWLVELLADPDPVLACRAAAALLDEGSRTAFEAVVEAQATHPEHRVRMDLAKKLGKFGGDDARDALIDRLQADDHPRVRRAAAEALGEFRDEAAASALIEVAQGEPATWHLHGAALESLGKSRDERARAVLEAALEVESWAHLVASKALGGLAHTERADILSVLVEHTRPDRPERLRGTACEALGRLGDKVDEVRDAACERLCEVLREPGYRSLVGAVQGLGKLRHPASTAALKQAHRSAADGRVRRLAFEALRKVSEGRTNEQALSGLRKELERLQQDNASLRDRLGKLESRVGDA